jgi:hypothetical protein
MIELNHRQYESVASAVASIEKNLIEFKKQIHKFDNIDAYFEPLERTFKCDNELERKEFIKEINLLMMKYGLEARNNWKI